MINKSLIKDLDEDVWQLATKIFIKNADTEIPQLQEAFNKKNYTEVKRLAHKLKGSSIAIGLEEFSNQAKKIEDKIESKNSSITIKTIQNFVDSFHKIKNTLS